MTRERDAKFPALMEEILAETGIRMPRIRLRPGQDRLAGRHKCIGEHFAWVELLLCAAILDPWVAAWLRDNPSRVPWRDNIELARPKKSPFPVSRDLPQVDDEVVDGVPVRIYQGEGRPTTSS